MTLVSAVFHKETRFAKEWHQLVDYASDAHARAARACMDRVGVVHRFKSCRYHPNVLGLRVLECF